MEIPSFRERPNNDLYCKDSIEFSQTNGWAKISIPYLYIIGVIDYRFIVETQFQSYPSSIHFILGCGLSGI
ncbi:hypothetical protein I7I53_11337 [Histoplasma capsulatum var. duboisii H88]|uniref:Uncharacterized protein n=1 Tax=Ajellomyces capsulatus (strain H88) TaxID=544711 RepID=A0A8A1L939_AJEC8|nr:hypothetical protein I7I53_11337 [Histoplasma capsulatum var. duboisii H88]